MEADVDFRASARVWRFAFAFSKRLGDFASLDDVVSQLQAALPTTDRAVEARAETVGRAAQAHWLLNYVVRALAAQAAASES